MSLNHCLDSADAERIEHIEYIHTHIYGVLAVTWFIVNAVPVLSMASHFKVQY